MKKIKLVVLLSLLINCWAGTFLSCNSAGDTSNSSSSTDDQQKARNTLIENGKALAGQHCQGCHQLPDPSLLDKENWQQALAMMAPRLGIYSHNGTRYKIFTDIDQSFYPDQPAMSSAQWQQVIDYYNEGAPAVLPLQQRATPIQKGLSFFSVQVPGQSFFREGNTASYIQVDTTTKPHRIFVNRAISNTLFMLDNKLNLLDSVTTNGTIVDINFNGDDLLACTIGASLFGNNLKAGSLLPLRIKNRKFTDAATALVDTLARPLDINLADINGDSKKDYLISEFGNLKGSLSWMENLGSQQFKKHIIQSLPGCSKAIVQDVNHDGKPDIWALFAQGEEGVFLFTNKGNGEFSTQQVLRFPPSYGSTSFELYDFNKDGSLDILYTCGDRGDGINQLKPYHGVYIFLNDGKNGFTKDFFFPINGCIKAMAYDFDNDGDLDIASIGFFTDNTQPEEGFVYFENKGNLGFQPYSLSPVTNFSKATTMDIGDIDNDGKVDIILGHGFLGNKKLDSKKPLFIVLKNNY